MNLAATQSFDHPLAELTQANAPARQLGVGCDQPEDIALLRVAVPAQQKIRAAEVKKGQGMRLGDLSQVHQPAQFLGSWRNGYRENLVAGVGGCEQMAHRADAADACCDGGHFCEGSALTEFFKTAVFRDVEAGSLDLASFIQMNRNLGVPLDSGHGIDLNHTRRTHAGLSSTKTDLIRVQRSRRLISQQRLQNRADPLSGRRAARQEDLHAYQLVDGQHAVHQFRNHARGMGQLCTAIRQVEVAAPQDWIGSLQHVAHPWDVGGDGAIAKAHQGASVLAHLSEERQVVGVGHASLHQSDINGFRVALLIGTHGAVDDLRLIGEVDQPFVEIEE